MNDELPSISRQADATASKGSDSLARFRTLWLLAPWLLFVAASLWTGGILFDSVPQTLKVSDQSADNSTNAKLESDLDFTGGISAIRQRIRALPSGTNIAVACDDSIYLTSAQIISLAIWSDGRRALQFERIDPKVLTETGNSGASATFIVGKERAWFPQEMERLSNYLFFIRQSPGKP